jgi:hypothetical protein
MRPWLHRPRPGPPEARLARHAGAAVERRGQRVGDHEADHHADAADRDLVGDPQRVQRPQAGERDQHASPGCTHPEGAAVHEKGVRLAQTMQVGACIPVGIQL